MQGIPAPLQDYILTPSEPFIVDIDRQAQSLSVVRTILRPFGSADIPST
jgi:hypothetical protein